MGFDIADLKVPDFTPQAPASGSSPGKGSTTSKTVKKAKTAREQIEDAAGFFMNLQGALGKLEQGYDTLQATVAENSIYALDAIVPALASKVSSLVQLGDTAIGTVYGNLVRGLADDKVRAQPFLVELHGSKPSQAVDSYGGTGEEPVLIAHDRIVTGSPAIDQGYLCEQGDDKPRCSFFSTTQRQEVISEFRGRTGDALQNFHQAIVGARIEVATETEEGMNWLSEMLFEAVAGGVLSGIVGLALQAGLKIATKLATSAVARVAGQDIKAVAHGVHAAFEAHEAIMEKVLEEGTKPVADRLKASAGDKKRGKDLFLERIADMATVVKQRISERAPAELDDIDLAALFEAFDVRHHSIGHYKGILEDLLHRYDTNKISELGAEDHPDGTEGKVLRAVIVHAYGQDKTAVVEQAFRVHHDTTPIGASPWTPAFEDIVREGRPRFVRWVDQDFVAIATTRSAAGEQQSFSEYATSEIWPVGDVYDVTDGWDELNPGGVFALTQWRDECATGTKGPIPVNDTMEHPEMNFVGSDESVGEEGDE